MSKSMCKRRGGWDEMGGNRWWYSMKGEGEDMLGKKSNIILQTKLSVEEKFFLRIFLTMLKVIPVSKVVSAVIFVQRSVTVINVL